MCCDYVLSSKFPYEQQRRVQSDVKTSNQLVANLTVRLNDATQYRVTDIDTWYSDTPFVRLLQL